MLKNLPFESLDFIKWYFVLFPKRVFTVCHRIVVLVNNEISFSLNIRLLFTPLFGDYSLVGRTIGFTVRVMQVFFGFFFVVLLSLWSVIMPLLWVTLPFFILYEFKLWVVVFIALAYLYKKYSLKNIPQLRVAKTTQDDIYKAVRPFAVACYTSMAEQSKITVDFLREKHIAYLLVKLELANEDFIQKISSKNFDVGYGAAQSELLKKAKEYALAQNCRFIEIEHLFLAALSLIPKIDMVLATYGSLLKNVEQVVSWLVVERERLDRILFWQEDYALPIMGGVGKGLTGHVTPKLDAISEDLTKKAQKGLIKNIVAHKDQIEKVVDILSSPNANVLLVGPPGCGKTSVVKGIALDIVRGTTEGAIKFKRLVNLDTSSLIAGTKSMGDISERIKGVIEEAKSSGDVILFFDEIHSFISGAGFDDSSNIFSILEPHLTGSDIQFIGATNQENYRKFIEPNGSFARLFQIIEIPPTSKEETMFVLQGVSHAFEKNLGIIITYPALDAIVKLSDKLIHERVFPDKAVEILNRTSSKVIKGSKILTSVDVKTEISEMTHVPVTALSEDESAKLLNLEAALKERVIGQDHAVVQVAKALQRARVGIRDEGKPIASFLFVGTTGVGKTETAKALAEKYFDDEKAMTRLDMSEYQQQDSISRLLGDPNGNTKGILTEAIRSKPYSLVLLDEIEKANSNILLTFLQVLDDGRLTDSSGVTVDFSNTIIIATSNVGTRAIQEAGQRGATNEEMAEVALKEVREKYAPEFLNRFDGVIVFKPLNMEVVKIIAGLMLNKIKKLADDKGVKISFEPELLESLVQRGYNPQWGARELRRVITDTVESYLALKLLDGSMKMGDEVTIGAEVFETA